MMVVIIATAAISIITITITATIIITAGACVTATFTGRMGMRIVTDIGTFAAITTTEPIQTVPELSRAAQLGSCLRLRKTMLR
jgi:hypothetical protein